MKKLTLAILIVASCTTTPPALNNNNRRVGVLFQSNRNGNLETCGCHTNPYGGIDRELNAISQIHKDGLETLFVDAGNSLVPKERAGNVEYYRKKAELTLPFFEELGLDVLAPGPNEFYLGSQSLRKLAQSSAVRFISSNVRPKVGERFLPTTLLVTKAGVRFGFIALSPTMTVSDWMVDDPTKTARDLLPTLRGTCDVVIVLSQLGNREDAKLSELPGIHLIVGSDEILATERPQWYAGRTLIVDPDLNGYLLGKLILDLKLPVKGFYCPVDISTNQSLLTEYLERASRKGGEKYAEYANKFKKTELLSIPEGGTEFSFELVKLDVNRFGAPNSLTQKMAQIKKAMHKFMAAQKKKPKAKK